ncbi:acyltransferase [Agaribacter marinus]|uniref:Acyltransferase n=2 Tax=Agaribacter marinus TaxID=1431249 RepID=A0AA37WLG9_9ALTE|nr:acyltransferase [Agaribacter marinus]
MSIIVDAIATFWISLNTFNQNVFSRTVYDVEGINELNIDDWYLVIANHQSWVDILSLQRVFNKKIPFLKFFLKKNLIFVPFLGLAWWGLDFPFMQRYSKQFLKKHPHLKGKDLETTKKACKKFSYKPVSVMNFVEGTRYTPQKANKKATFNHLLSPKAGGVAFVLSAMKEQLTHIVDVTIYYPHGVPSFWDFASGKVSRIVVRVNTIRISKLFDDGTFSENYFTDDQQRATFQSWLNSQWKQKDKALADLRKEYQL